jgi:hypothetical protein
MEIEYRLRASTYVKEEKDGFAASDGIDCGSR